MIALALTSPPDVPGLAATRARAVRRSRGRSAFVRCLLGLLLLALLPAIVHAQAVSKEYRLKAAFLYNFTKFVSWPPRHFADDTSPLVIAVLGANPFEQELATLVKDRSVDGRPIQVRVIRAPEDFEQVHIVFVRTGEESRLPPSLFGRPGVLTVGESPEFTRRGGVITFVVVDEKVRFEINQGSAEEAGLKLSGQLLKLATIVRKAP